MTLDLDSAKHETVMSERKRLNETKTNEKKMGIKIREKEKSERSTQTPHFRALKGNTKRSSIHIKLCISNDIYL